MAEPRIPCPVTYTSSGPGGGPGAADLTYSAVPVPIISSAQLARAIRFRWGRLSWLAPGVPPLRHDDRLCCFGWPI